MWVDREKGPQQVNEEAQRPVEWTFVLMAVKATSSNDRDKGEEKAQPSSKMFSEKAKVVKRTRSQNQKTLAKISRNGICWQG